MKHSYAKIERPFDLLNGVQGETYLLNKNPNPQFSVSNTNEELKAISNDDSKVACYIPILIEAVHALQKDIQYLDAQNKNLRMVLQQNNILTEHQIDSERLTNSLNTEQYRQEFTLNRKLLQKLMKKTEALEKEKGKDAEFTIRKTATATPSLRSVSTLASATSKQPATGKRGKVSTPNSRLYTPPVKKNPKRVEFKK